MRRNLDVFPDGSNNILDRHLKVDASRAIALDSFALPTGDFINVTDTPFDFRREQQIGARWDNTVDLCGSGTLHFLLVVRLLTVSSTARVSGLRPRMGIRQRR